MHDIYTVEQRYLNDPLFHAMVDTLESILTRTDITPTEVREALIFALLRITERRKRKTRFTYTTTENFFNEFNKGD